MTNSRKRARGGKKSSKFFIKDIPHTKNNFNFLQAEGLMRVEREEITHAMPFMSELGFVDGQL